MCGAWLSRRFQPASTDSPSTAQPRSRSEPSRIFSPRRKRWIVVDTPRKGWRYGDNHVPCRVGLTLRRNFDPAISCTNRVDGLAQANSAVKAFSEFGAELLRAAYEAILLRARALSETLDGEGITMEVPPIEG